jgi:hypothetical protein
MEERVSFSTEGKSGPFFRPGTGLCLPGMAMNPALKRWAIFIKSISVPEAPATKDMSTNRLAPSPQRVTKAAVFVVSFVPFV